MKADWRFDNWPFEGLNGDVLYWNCVCGLVFLLSNRVVILPKVRSDGGEYFVEMGKMSN